MITDNILAIESYIILIEKQQKYQHYHQENLPNINNLQAEKYYLPIKVKWQRKLNLLIYF